MLATFRRSLTQAVGIQSSKADTADAADLAQASQPGIHWLPAGSQLVTARMRFRSNLWTTLPGGSQVEDWEDARRDKAD